MILKYFVDISCWDSI